MRNLLPDLNLLGYGKEGENKTSGSIEASVLFADISGFTNMTRTLMSEGKDGAEILSDFMNRIFSPLIESVYDNGGFIINFAGDAFTAVFRNDLGHLAVSTAVEIRDFFLANPEFSHGKHNFSISAKMGVSKGTLSWTAVKGQNDLRNFLFFGDVIDEAAQAEHNCCGNEICVNSKVAENLGDNFVITDKDSNSFVEKMVLAVQSTPLVPEIDTDMIRSFVPKAVSEQTIAGAFRKVVSLFISYTFPDDLKEIDKAIEQLSDSVTKYGGYISGFDSGDKGATVLALFGAPVSYEDDLERAVNCVMDLRKNFDRDFRSGITEGVVYAGFTGSDKRAAYTALGDNVNLSARVMMKADMGRDWIAGQAAERSGMDFVLDTVGGFMFKGIDEEIEVFELKGKREKEEAVSYSTAFTGREKELASLIVKGQEAVNEKRFKVCSIFGEAGIGKSRLVYEVRQKFSDKFKVFSLATDTILRQSMNMFTLFFQRFFDQSENFTQSENRMNFENSWKQFISELQTVPEELEGTKPYVAALAGVSIENSVFDILDAKSRYENTLFAVADFFTAFSKNYPLMIVMDDLHAIDNDSLEVVKTMMKRLADEQVVIYILSRLKDDGSKPEFYQSITINSLELNINKLHKDDVPSFVGNILDGESDEELNRFVFSRSEGNPFFMEQLVLFIKEQDYIKEKDGKICLKSDDVEIPGEVNSLLVSRLDRLSANLKELVFRASVIGNDIDLVVLSDIFEDGGVESLLSEGVDELVWNEVSKIIYAFRHALLRDAAYNMQLKARLRSIHKNVATAIEKNYPGEDRFYSSLAFHYEKAEEVEKEKTFLKKAADYAKEQYHNIEAETMYLKLMELLEDPKELIETGHLLGRVAKISGKWDLAEKTFRDSLEKAKELGDSLLVADSMKEMGYMLLEKGCYDEAQPLLDSAVKEYRALNRPEGECDVEGYRGLIHYYKGELDDAIEHFNISLELAQRVDYKSAIALSNRYLGGVSYYRSEYAKARNYYERQLEISKEMNNVIDIAVAENNLGLVTSHLNEFDSAIKYYQRALDTYKKINIRQYICYTSNNLGELKYWLGEYDEAKQLFEDQLMIASDLGIKRHVSIAYNMLGNINRIKTDYEKALDLYNRAIEIGEELNLQTILCEYYLEKAVLFFETERFEKSLELAEKAISVSAEVNRTDFLIRSQLLKWRIVSRTDKDKAVSEMLNMLKDMAKDEHKAELNYHLFKLTKDEKYKDEALKIFKSLRDVAPKAVYIERINSLESQ